AEDGIRDFHVTGVQTCALPILRTPRTPEWQLALPPRNLCRASGNCGDVSRVDAFTARHRIVYAGGVFGSVGGKSGRDLVAVDGRSEERRVGKEWRAWWEAAD